MTCYIVCMLVQIMLIYIPELIYLYNIYTNIFFHVEKSSQSKLYGVSSAETFEPDKMSSTGVKSCSQ